MQGLERPHQPQNFPEEFTALGVDRSIRLEFVYRHVVRVVFWLRYLVHGYRVFVLWPQSGRLCPLRLTWSTGRLSFRLVQVQLRLWLTRLGFGSYRLTVLHIWRRSLATGRQLWLLQPELKKRP